MIDKGFFIEFECNVSQSINQSVSQSIGDYFSHLRDSNLKKFESLKKNYDVNGNGKKKKKFVRQLINFMDFNYEIKCPSIRHFVTKQVFHIYFKKNTRT